MKWGEWHRHCDEALGYYWPSDDMWGGGSSASDCGWLQGTEATESRTTDEVGVLYMYIHIITLKTIWHSLAKLKMHMPCLPKI